MFPKGNVQQQVLSAGHVRQLSQICQKITTNQGVTRTLEANSKIMKQTTSCCQKLILQKALHLAWQEPTE
jgi:hypothetical protein